MTELVSTQRPALSIVILCYKAADRVPGLVKNMKAVLDGQSISYEIVLVGNYNESEKDSDTTPSQVRAAADADEHVVAVVEEKRGMYGWDARSGLAHARGEVIGYIDGDDQNPAADVLRCYKALIAERADIAMPYRVTRNDGTKRTIISRIFNLMTRSLFPRVVAYDINAKPKLFRRDVYERLSLGSSDWFIDAEVAIRAAQHNFKITQIPTVFLANAGRKSFVTAMTLVEFVVNLFYYRFFGRVRDR